MLLVKKAEKERKENKTKNISSIALPHILLSEKHEKGNFLKTARSKPFTRAGSIPLFQNRYDLIPKILSIC